MNTVYMGTSYQTSCDLKLTDGVNDYYVLPNNAEVGPEMRIIRYSIAQEAERLISTSISCTGEINQLQSFLSKKHHGSVWTCSDKELQKRTAELIINCNIVIVARNSSGLGHGTFAGEKPVEPLSDKFRFAFSLPCFGNSAITYTIVDDQSGDIIPGVFLKVTFTDDRFKELASTRAGQIEVEKVKRGESGFDLDVSNIFSATLDNTFAYVTVDSKPSEPEDGEADSPNNAKRLHTRLLSKKRNDFRYISDIIEHKVAAGETLASIARANDSTFKDLAYFNWGEYERTKIWKLMARDIGCSEKTTDGRDYQFTGEEVPGIVYIPAPLSVRDLKTNKAHTIRVKKVGYKLRYRYEFDIDKPENEDDVFYLVNKDETWKYTVKVNDLEEVEPDFVDIIFPMPPKNGTYSFVHDYSDGSDPSYLFEDLTYDELFFADNDNYEHDIIVRDEDEEIEDEYDI